MCKVINAEDEEEVRPQRPGAVPPARGPRVCTVSWQAPRGTTKCSAESKAINTETQGKRQM